MYQMMINKTADRSGCEEMWYLEQVESGHN